jgi:hypothetical protein
MEIGSYHTQEGGGMSELFKGTGFYFGAMKTLLN